MRRLHVVSESGRGSEWIYIAPEMGPGVEAVALVSDAGYGATPVYIVSEPGHGTKVVFPVEGSHLLPGRGPTPNMVMPPNLDLLSVEEDRILANLNQLWQHLQANGTSDLTVVDLLLERSMAVIDYSWPQPVWSEDVLFKAWIAAATLAEARGILSVAREVEAIGRAVLNRRWLQGGPAGYFEASDARGVMDAVGRVGADRAHLPAATWQTDPTGRHDLRYWDGEAWTEHVSDAGVTALDPLT